MLAARLHFQLFLFLAAGVVWALSLADIPVVPLETCLLGRVATEGSTGLLPPERMPYMAERVVVAREMQPLVQEASQIMEEMVALLYEQGQATKQSLLPAALRQEVAEVAQV